jgi:hypothetical protein
MMRISGQLSNSSVGLNSLSFMGVNLTTSVFQLTEYAVLIRFGLYNENSSTMIVDLACSQDLYVDGRDNATLYDFGGAGFTMNGTTYWFTFLFRSCPLVRDVSTYWIGLDYGADFWNQSMRSSYSEDAGCAWSWQNLSIPVGGSMTVGVVFQSAVIEGKPGLKVSEATLNGNLLHLSGTISNASSCTLYAVIDDDLSQLSFVQSGLGTLYSVEWALPDLIGTGIHSLLFSAVDEANGRISDGELIWVPFATQSHPFLESGTPPESNQVHGSDSLAQSVGQFSQPFLRSDMFVHGSDALFGSFRAEYTPIYGQNTMKISFSVPFARSAAMGVTAILVFNGAHSMRHIPRPRVAAADTLDGQAWVSLVPPFALALSTILIVISAILRARRLRPMDEETDSDSLELIN